VEGLIAIVFTITFVLYLASSIILRSVNVTLNLQRQGYYDRIAKVKAANESAAVQVQQLSAYDRVSTIAGSDVATNDGSVVNITE